MEGDGSTKAALPAADAGALLLTRGLPGTGGRIRERLEDFVVHEVPAYLPCGEGEHLMVRVEKRGANTDFVAKALAERAGVPAGAVGYAGRKDRHAVTTQWMTLQGAEAARLEGAEGEGFRVLEVSRHRNKLKAGHLRGNRFEVVVRGACEDAEARARAVLERLGSEGMPNVFGPQRFGTAARNVSAATDWIVRGRKPPREKGRRRLLVSALQAELFNAVVARRLSEGCFSRPLAGDVLKKRDTGGLFVGDGGEETVDRVRRGEVSPTGPIYGSKMWWPEAEAGALEREVLAAAGLGEEHLERFRADGKGSRRPIRVFPEGVEASMEGGALRLAFTLEAGSFATALLAEVTKAELGAEVGAGGSEG